MFYVLSDEGIEREYSNLEDAIHYVDTHEDDDLWISSDEDEEPTDIDSDFGFDPYEGCYTYDC